MEVWPRIVIVGTGDEPRAAALMLATKLRQSLFNRYLMLNTRTTPRVEVALTDSLKKEMRKANAAAATHVVIMGGETCAVKDMSTSDQFDVKMDYICDTLSKLVEDHHW